MYWILRDPSCKSESNIPLQWTFHREKKSSNLQFSKSFLICELYKTRLHLLSGCSLPFLFCVPHLSASLLLSLSFFWKVDLFLCVCRCRMQVCVGYSYLSSHSPEYSARPPNCKTVSCLTGLHGFLIFTPLYLRVRIDQDGKGGLPRSGPTWTIYFSSNIKKMLGKSFHFSYSSYLSTFINFENFTLC